MVDTEVVEVDVVAVDVLPAVEVEELFASSSFCFTQPDAEFVNVTL